MKSHDGTTTIAVIGLSGENMARLMADEPILLNLAEFGLPAQDILIIGGKDEDTIEATLRSKVDERSA